MVRAIDKLLAYEYKYTGLPNNSKNKYRYSIHLPRVLEQHYKKWVS